MKNLFLTALLLLTMGATAYSQLHVVKTNTASWFIKSANVTYEYKAGPSTSIGLGFGYKLPGTIDVDALAEQSDGDEYRWQGEIDPKGLYVTPFFRFYTGQSMKGFYFEAFLRYYNYTFEVPYEYDKNNQTLTGYADGDANGYGGGLTLGVQILAGKHFVIDIFAGMGVAAGKAHIETMDPQLDATDYQKIKNTIEENRDTEVDIFLFDKTLSNIVADANSTSAWADIEDSAFPIIRAGVAFGYAF
jgi:hypothetical protein